MSNNFTLVYIAVAKNVLKVSKECAILDVSNTATMSWLGDTVSGKMRR